MLEASLLEALAARFRYQLDKYVCQQVWAVALFLAAAASHRSVAAQQCMQQCISTCQSQCGILARYVPHLQPHSQARAPQ